MFPRIFGYMKPALLVMLPIAGLLVLAAGCSKNQDNSTSLPVSPVGLTATATSATGAELRWTDAAQNEEGFRIERKTGSGAYAVIGTVHSNIVFFSDTSLQPLTAYTYRICAFNSAGASIRYSNEASLTTPDSITPLPSVTICQQIWSLRNLDVSRYANGDPIPQVTDPVQWQSLTTGAWCWYNNDSAGYAAVYGKLYNGFAVTDPRGLAPRGWHLPSDGEWEELTDCLGGAAAAGGGMKQSGTQYWQSPNTGATNQSGFTALPGGFRNASGDFYTLGQQSYWWSITLPNPIVQWFRNLNYLQAGVVRDQVSPAFGFSVRCIRN